MKAKLQSLALLAKRHGPVGMLVLVPSSAFAAVPANVTTALGDALTDATTVAGLALIIVVGIAAFRYMRRAV